MKEIELRADEPFFTHVDVAVIDFPDGCREKGRQRCKVTVEFAESDVRQLQKRGLDFEEIMAYYRDLDLSNSQIPSGTGLDMYRRTGAGDENRRRSGEDLLLVKLSFPDG